MDEEEDIMMYYFLLIMSSYWQCRKSRETSSTRRFAVKPVNRLRHKKGLFNNLIQSLLSNDKQSFFKYTRMSPDLFHKLLQLVESRLQKNVHRNPIPPAHRLILTLHYLAEGCSMQEVAWGHYLGLTTVSNIIRETTAVLCDVLSPEYLKPPSVDDLTTISEGFYNRWNVPNCIGAVDGKHVQIKAPKHSGSTFLNDKKHTVVLMATSDANYRFSLVDIGAAGSYHDSVVFRENGFGHAVLNQHINIPPPRNLPKTDITLPHYFVADTAFPLHENIMRPYPGDKLPENYNVFNDRLSRARRSIENTFGVLVARWGILKGPILADLCTIETIIKSTVVLHNYLQRSEDCMPDSARSYCPPGFVDTTLPDGSITPGEWREHQCNLQSVGRVGANNAKASVKNNREKLCEFFNSNVGGLSWPIDHLMEESVP